MSRGPKPEPAEIKAAKGNPGHRTLAPTPEAVPALAHGAPEFLTDEGLAIWQHLQPLMASLRFVRETDRLTLGRYCDQFALWLKMRRQVEEQGATVTTSSAHVQDMLRVNPAFRAMMSLEDKLTAFEDRFGLSPAARQSLLTRMASAGANPQLPAVPHAGASMPGAPGSAGLGATIEHDPDSPLGLFTHAASERPN